MNNIHSIMSGDWSNDGHGMTLSTIIRSNFNKDEIENAYKEGIEKIGFDFKEDYCREYEDDFLPNEIIEKLKSQGIHVNFESDYEGSNTGDGVHIRPDEYTEIYLKLCQLGNSNFNYTIIKTPELHIGGYGLFYD